MAKSTRQHVFEGMELLPEALAPFVEKRLESSIQGHWQVQVFERYKGLRPDTDRLGSTVTLEGYEHLLDGCLQRCPWPNRAGNCQ